MIGPPAATKKPRDNAPGPLCFASLARSVLPDDRAAEAVVDAGGDEVRVLLDVVVAGVADARERADATEVAVSTLGA